MMRISREGERHSSVGGELKDGGADGGWEELGDEEEKKRR